MPDESIIAQGLELLRKGTADISTTSCPYCGSNDIEATHYDGGDMVVETCRCDKCGGKWELTYEVCGIELTEPPRRDEDKREA